MRFASVADVKNQLSEYLARARKKKEAIIVTHHGKPYALIQPLSEQDLEELEWKELEETTGPRVGRGRGCPLRLPINAVRLWSSMCPSQITRDQNHGQPSS